MNIMKTTVWQAGKVRMKKRSRRTEEIKNIRRTLRIKMWMGLRA